MRTALLQLFDTSKSFFFFYGSIHSPPITSLFKQKKGKKISWLLLICHQNYSMLQIMGLLSIVWATSLTGRVKLSYGFLMETKLLDTLFTIQNFLKMS